MSLPFKIFLFSLLFLISCRATEDDLPTEPILKLDETISVNGLIRNYHIQHPQNTDNRPLVVVLHGHGGSSDQSIGMGLGKNPQRIWLDLARDEEFIVVVPNGELGMADTRGWNDCRNDAPSNPTTDDVQFIASLLEKIKREYNHDTDRVYVAGVSNGALMTHRLVQEIPNKIAAFACIVNNIPENSNCQDADVAISALYMNGTDDPLVPYQGGQILSNRGSVISTDESIAYWVERNQTDANPTVESLENLNTEDNSTVEKFTYDNGLNNSQVVLYKITGGGHTEPSLVEHYSQVYLNIVGVQNKDIEMTDEIWNFFKDKSK